MPTPYSGDGNNGEFVEIFNRTGATVDLVNWKIVDGGGNVDVLQDWDGNGALTDGDPTLDTTSLPAGKYALVVTNSYESNEIYDLPTGSYLLTIGNTTLGNGLGTTEAVYLVTTNNETVSAYGVDFSPSAPATAHSYERFQPWNNADTVGSWRYSYYVNNAKSIATPGAVNSPAPSLRDIVINEIGYDGASDEFIELYNTTDTFLSLAYFSIDAVASGDFRAGLADSIGPKSFYLIEDRETATAAQHQLLDALSIIDGGENLVLLYANGYTDTITLDSTMASWTDKNNNISYERIASNSYGATIANWRQGVRQYSIPSTSGFGAGTPGETNTPWTNFPVVINELMTNNGADSDYIELYNRSTNAADTFLLYQCVLTESRAAGIDTEVTGFTVTSWIGPQKYYLIENKEEATSVSGDLLDVMAINNNPGVIRLYAPDNVTVWDTAGSVDAWFTSNAGRSIEKKNPALDGSLAASWRSNPGTLLVGGVYGTPAEVNTPANAIPTALAADIIVDSTFADTAVPAGRTFQVRTRYTDLDSAADILRMDLRFGNGTDTIALFAIRPALGAAVTVEAGAAYVETATIDTSTSGNDVYCTWTLRFGWSFPRDTGYRWGIRVSDDEPETSAWADSTTAWRHETTVLFSGTLAGTGVFSGAVATGKYFRGGETVTWSGLTPYYGGGLIPLSVAHCTFTIIDDDGAATTQTGATALNHARAVSAVTDASESVAVFITGLPAGGRFTDTRLSATFIVDATAPVITKNRDTYTIKAENGAAYGALFDVDFSDATSHIDTAYVNYGAETQVITAYGGANYTTNWAISNALYTALAAGHNAVNVTAVDSAGNSATTQIFVAKEPIAVDGDTTDWKSDEVMGRRKSNNFRLTWDDTSLYFSYGGADGNTADADFFVYLRTGNSGNYSATTHNWDGTHTLPFAADYFIGVDSSTYDELYQFDGVNWTGAGNVNREIYSGWSGVPVTEYRIGWNRLGGKPTTLRAIAFHKWESAGNVYNSFPVTNIAANTAGVTFTDFYLFPSLADTVSPDSAAMASLTLNLSKASVTVGETFLVTVGAVNSRGETLPGINTTCTLTVSAGDLGVSTITLVNGVGTITDSILNAHGNLTIRATAVHNTAESVTANIMVTANIIYGWHAASLNRPDTGAGDVDSYMRKVVRDGRDTMWPRLGQTDSPMILWLGKSGDTYPAAVTLWYRPEFAGWTSMNPVETLVQGADTFYKFHMGPNFAGGYRETTAYYFRLARAGKETTYVHGNGVIDNVTDSATSIGEATARTNAFFFRVRSTAPSAPDTAISPWNGQTNVATRNPTITWRAANDVDSPAPGSDTIVDYFFEIASLPNMSDTASFAADRGWRGSAATSHTCSTTLEPFKWYYWRVRAKDSDGFVSGFSDTFRFQINAIIGIDAILLDWTAGEKIPTLNTGAGHDLQSCLGLKQPLRGMGQEGGVARLRCRLGLSRRPRRRFHDDAQLGRHAYASLRLRYGLSLRGWGEQGRVLA
jgi:hypothetical protein